MCMCRYNAVMDMKEMTVKPRLKTIFMVPKLRVVMLCKKCMLIGKVIHVMLLFLWWNFCFDKWAGKYGFYWK
jgi:hypothetical protein